MIMTIVKEYKISTEIKMKQHSYDNLQEYIVRIETLYQSLRSFKHDYVNIMVSIAGFIEADDMIGLKNYYEKQILPVSVRFVQSEDTIVRLHYLDLLELKSLISVKLNYALELNIEVILEIAEKIDKINMKSNYKVQSVKPLRMLSIKQKETDKLALIQHLKKHLMRAWTVL